MVRHTTWTIATIVALGLLGAARAEGQNPDLVLSPAERDSVLAGYRQIFPILGRKAVERGFLLPLPVGLNVNMIYADQGVALSQLGLSVNDNPVEPVDWIVLGEAQSRVLTANARADLWVLPFLNVYGFYGLADAEIDVPVTAPVDFTSHVEQTGRYWGVGLTGTMGIKRNFLAVDVNWSWTDLEKLAVPVEGRILGIRYGRTISLGRPDRRANFWIGTTNFKMVSETNGTITLADALPPGVADSLRNQLANYQNSTWYQNLGPAAQRLADSLVAGVMNANLGATRINYNLSKSPADPWNMIIGGSYEPTRHWAFRGEVGFIGRFQVLLVANYRFGL